MDQHIPPLSNENLVPSPFQPFQSSQTSSHLARKRQRLAALRDSPSRSSFRTQMTKIFNTPTPPPQRNLSLLTIPDHPLHYFHPFDSSLHSSQPDGKPRDSPVGSPVSRPCTANSAADQSPDPTSSSSWSEGVGRDHTSRPVHVRDDRPPQSGEAAGCWDSEDEDPLNDLERAVAHAFTSRSPVPTDRRKGRNIPALPNITPAPQSPSPPDTNMVDRSPFRPDSHEPAYSTEDWTDDNIFFPCPQHTPHSGHRIHHQPPRTYPSLSRSPGSAPSVSLIQTGPSRQSCPLSPHPSSSSSPSSSQEAIPQLSSSPHKHPPVSSFSRPTFPSAATDVCEDTAGVPLCMEEHPPSISSDADDEADEEPDVDDEDEEENENESCDE